MHMLFRFGLLLAAAAAFAPREAAAQNYDRRPIKRNEVVAAQVPDAFHLVARVRPQWLSASADTSAAALRPTLVYLDGRHVGHLPSLRGISLARLESIRMDSIGAYRTVLGERIEVYEQVLKVRTLEAVQPRLFVVAGLATFMTSAQPWLQDQLRGAGFTAGPAHGPRSYAANVGAAAAVRYRVRGPVSVELSGIHTPESQIEGYGRDWIVTNRHTTTELSLPVAVEHVGLRVGLGPAVRRADWTWARRNCQCDNVETSSSVAAGATWLVGFSGGRGPLHFEGRVQGQMYGGQEIGPYELESAPPLSLGRSSVSGWIGVGARL